MYRCSETSSIVYYNPFSNSKVIINIRLQVIYSENMSVEVNPSAKWCTCRERHDSLMMVECNGGRINYSCPGNGWYHIAHLNNDEQNAMQTTFMCDKCTSIRQSYQLDEDDDSDSWRQNSRYALVLGMGYTSDALAMHYAETAATNTSNAYVRDHYRLMQLESSYPIRVCSVNKDLSVNDAEPRKHIQTTFNARGAKVVYDTLTAESSSKMVTDIFLDYFRFPPEYMRSVFTPFLTEMLPELKKLGVVTDHTRIVIPNLPELFQLIEPITTAHRGLRAPEYELYAATNLVHQALLGAYTNEGEIRTLNNQFPFVEIYI